VTFRQWDHVAGLTPDRDEAVLMSLRLELGEQVAQEMDTLWQNSLPDIENQKPGFSLAKAFGVLKNAQKATIPWFRR
jgi:hypothetical protein